MTKVIDCNVSDDFFNYGDSLLLDSGMYIALFDVDKDGTKYHVKIAVQGDVRIDDSETDESYYSPSDFPEELKKCIENGDIDNNRFSVENNNWYEVMIFQSDKTTMIDSDLMECEPKDFTDIDDLKNYVVEFVDDFID